MLMLVKFEEYVDALIMFFISGTLVDCWLNLTSLFSVGCWEFYVLCRIYRNSDSHCIVLWFNMLSMPIVESTSFAVYVVFRLT
jgi:hypothetical protein